MTNGKKAESVDELIDEGLKAYGSGQFRNALSSWEKALQKDPGNQMAEEYIKLAKQSLGASMPSSAQTSEADEESGDDGSSVQEEAILQRAIKLLSDRAWQEAYVYMGRASKDNRTDDRIAGLNAISRTQLYTKYYERVGDMSAFPRLSVSTENIKNLDLSNEDGFIISLIDGTLSYEDIISLSRMERFSVLAVFCRLLEEGVIET